MKKTSILKRFYGSDRAKSTMQSVEAIDRVVDYKGDLIKKYLGKGLSVSLRRVTEAIKYLAEDIIEPNKVIYKDFYEMVQVLISEIFQYLSNHPETKDINRAVERYKSEELINLRYQFDESNLKLRKISNVLSETLDHQKSCLSQIKTAIKRAERIKKGVSNES